MFEHLQTAEEDKPGFSDLTIPGFSDWYKEDENSKIWWVEELGVKGRHLFSFDKKKVYNLFADYPHNMTSEEVAVFDKENPFWADFLQEESSN